MATRKANTANQTIIPRAWIEAQMSEVISLRERVAQAELRSAIQQATAGAFDAGAIRILAGKDARLERRAPTGRGRRERERP